MIVSNEAFDRIKADCENPPPPTEQLVKLIADVRRRYPKIWARLAEADAAESTDAPESPGMTP